MNKANKLTALSLMCKSLMCCIELYQSGIEDYDSVITRAVWLASFIEEELSK